MTDSTLYSETITPTVRPMVAAKTKNSPSASVAPIRGISAWIPIPRTNWPMIVSHQERATELIRLSFI